MSKKWDEMVASFRKSQGGESETEDDDVVIVEEDEGGDDYDDVDTDYDDVDTGDGDADAGSTGEDGGGFVDATEDLKKTNASIGEIKDVLLKVVESLDSIGSVNKALHKSNTAILKRLNMPNPRKSVTSAAELPAGTAMKKSQGAGGTRHKPFTAETRDEAYALLAKSGVDWQTQGCIETQINKSMCDPNFQLSPKYMNLLVDLVQKEGK